MPRTTGRVLPCLVLGSFLAITACEKNPEELDYVARIGETLFTEADLQKALPPKSSSLGRASLVEDAIHQWAERELLFREAVHKGLDQDMDLERRIDNYRKSLYGSTFLDIYLSDRVLVSTDEVREHYTKNRDAFRRAVPEAQVSHFLLPTEDEAADVKKRLLSYDGEVRQNLLASHRVDIKTVRKGQLVPELDRQLFGSRQPRGVLGPVRTAYGFHVLEVLDLYPEGTYRGLDEVYDEISQRLFRLKSRLLHLHLMDSLKAAYSLDINRDYIAHD
ncbi:MAG: peptidyl-prolyl cis-trans isomerase [Candidatus Neomarinimicrobiota bacterium]